MGPLVHRVPEHLLEYGKRVEGLHERLDGVPVIQELPPLRPALVIFFQDDKLRPGAAGSVQVEVGQVTCQPVDAEVLERLREFVPLQLGLLAIVFPLVIDGLVKGPAEFLGKLQRGTREQVGRRHGMRR